MFFRIAVLFLAAFTAGVSLAAEKDACSVLTKEQIKALTGLAFSAAEKVPSHSEGSSCKYSEKVGGLRTVILQLGKPKYYYDFKEKDNKPLGKFVDKGFYKGPDSGNAYAQAVKGDTSIVLTVYSKKSISSQQLLATMKHIADQF